MPSPVPTYLSPAESYTTILTRLLAYLAKYDTGDGGTWRMVEAPVALELDRWRNKAIHMVSDLFLATATSSGLDAWGTTLSQPRKQPTSSNVTLALTGTVGALIPAGTQFSTLGTTSSPATSFATSADCTIGGGGSISVAARAVLAGSGGNVGPALITAISTPRTGLVGCTNPAAAGSGQDLELDSSFRIRLALKFQPSTGGNLVDYETWVLAQPAVGAVAIIPQRDFSTNVSIAIVGPGPAFADPVQATIDAVQAALMNPYRRGPYEAELTTGPAAFVRTGAGVSQQADATASSGQAIQMAANAAQGQLQMQVDTLLPEAGIYLMYTAIKTSGTIGTGALAVAGVWNSSHANWAKTAPSDAAYGGATAAYAATGLSGLWLEYPVRFYWNGTDVLYLQLQRLINTGGNDATTSVWFDKARITSVQGDGLGLAPVCHNVVVQGPIDVAIDVQATLTRQPLTGQTTTDVTNAALASINAYLSSIVFASANDVLWGSLASAILGTPGVTDISGLQIKKSSSGTWTTSSIAIAVQEVARQGTFTLS